MEEIRLELEPLGQSDLETKERELFQGEARQALEFSGLNPAEQKMVREFIGKIDLLDSNMTTSYGASIQNKVAGFSDSVLKNMRMQENEDAGKLLTALVVRIQSFDSACEEKKGLLKIFGGGKKSLEKVAEGYPAVQANIDEISTQLHNYRRNLMREIARLDAMYETNCQYLKELDLYLIAGKEKLQETEETAIPALEAAAERTKDPMDTQRVYDMRNAAIRFEKRLHDLRLSRTISLQMAPQIRLVQGICTQLADKIQSSISGAIPLWKNQIILALGLSGAREALQAQRRVADMSNELLKQNSEILKQRAKEVAADSEKSTLSVEAIKKTNQELVETINGVLDIQQKGKTERSAAEHELLRIEAELREALLRTQGRI